MIDERIAERRADVRDERRRKRLRRTVLVACALVVLVALILIERSPLVGIEEVEIVGTERLDEDTVRDAAALELGTSTLRLRLNDVAAQVRDLPLVSDANAYRANPLTVVIEVSERVPSVVATGGGQSVLVDREGVVIDEQSSESLPVINLDDAPPAVGEHVEEHPALANAHRAWRGLSGPLRVEVVSYEAAGSEDLTLQLSSGIEVRFGRADRVDEKVRALGAVLGDIEDADVTAIDVRAPTAPVVVGAE